MRATYAITAAMLVILTGCNKPKSEGAATAPGATPAGGSAGQTNVLDHMPARKSGLWIQTMSRDGQPTHMGEIKMCLDPATDAKMSMMGRGVADKLCQTSTSRGLDGVIRYASTCKIGAAGSVSSKGEITGDFSSAYKVHSESDLAGVDGSRAPSHHVTDVDARYGGPCPAGMVAGDMMIGNAIHFNINKMPSLGQAMGGG